MSEEQTSIKEVPALAEPKKWAVEVTANGVAYRANPKTYTKRDGLAKAQLETNILRRDYPDDTDGALAMLHLNNFYPLLRHGILEAEGFELPLTEEVFWDLPEQFVFELSEAIQEENPQYAIPFSELQRAMWNGFQPNTETPPTPTAEKEPGDKTIS
jgi:hypothetical protein